MNDNQIAGKTLLNIRSHLNGLTKMEQKVAHYILQNAQDIIYQSVTELAERADVGETTVLRLCRKLKFHGFQDFKLSLAQDLVKPVEHLHHEVTEEDDPKTLSRKVFETHIQVLKQTNELCDEKQIGKAIQSLIKAQRIYFFGVGSSGLTALQSANSFSRIGKTSNFFGDTHLQAMHASFMNKDDVAVGISNSGSTKDTIDNLTIAKKAGARTIVITSNARSPITKIADIVLLIVAREGPLQGSSFAATISQLGIIDVLNVAVSLHLKEQALKYRELAAKSISDKLY